MPIILKSGSLNLLEPSGPVQACNGIALPLYRTRKLQKAPSVFMPNFIDKLILCQKFTQVETDLNCYWYYTQIRNLPSVLHSGAISLGEKRLEWVTDHSTPSNAKTLHYMPSWNYRDFNVTLTLNYIPSTVQPLYILTNVPSSYTEVICSQ